jgi:parvulin-like peptidyl-prolyl isomerase
MGTGQEIRLAQIRFATAEAADAARRRLDQGEAFDALALELSTDRTTGANGGDLGFQLESELVPSVRDTISAAAVGAIVGPLQIGSAWFLFRVADRRAAGSPSLEELRPRIVEWLRFQEMAGLQERLEASARIERLSPDTGDDAPQPSTAPAAEASAPTP